MTERERLVALLVHHEGESLVPYTDTVGKVTIGVGRNLTDRGISMKTSRQMLDEDLDDAITTLARYAWFGTMNAVRQRAMIDMHFNLGASRFREFKKMIAALDHADFKTAAKEMLHSPWASQVGTRAVTLARMIETGVV